MRVLLASALLALAACTQEPPSRTESTGLVGPIECRSVNRELEPTGFSIENVTLVGADEPKRVFIFTHLDREHAVSARAKRLTAIGRVGRSSIAFLTFGVRR